MSYLNQDTKQLFEQTNALLPSYKQQPQIYQYVVQKVYTPINSIWDSPYLVHFEMRRKSGQNERKGLRGQQRGLRGAPSKREQLGNSGIHSHNKHAEQTCNNSQYAYQSDSSYYLLVITTALLALMIGWSSNNRQFVCQSAGFMVI